MTETGTDSQLGKLEIVYGPTPVLLQRAVVVALLSFVFFLTMLVAFSLTQRFVFFLLSTAFMVIEVLTLFGWLTLRRNELKIYENGFVFKKQTYLWNQIKSVSQTNDSKRKTKYEIETQDGKKLILNESINGVKGVASRIKSEIAGK